MHPFSELFGEDVMEILSVESCVRRRDSLGGTSPQSLEEQIATGKALIEVQKSFLEEKKTRIQEAWHGLM